MRSPAVDLTDHSLYRAGVPHDVFAALREAGPVHRHRTEHWSHNGWDGPVEFWSVVSHREIQQANRDWETLSAIDGPGLTPTLAERRGHTIVSMDPPDHSRMRRLVSAGFTPRMIAELEGHLVRRAGMILDDVAAKGECEFVSEVAYQLPMHVIADIMGIPDADRQWVFGRTDTMMRAFDPLGSLTVADRVAAERDLFEYAQQLSAYKREHPADDVWTILTQTGLSVLELDMFFLILALAGSETTRNAISQGLMALLDNPAQLAALRADPSLLPTAADEMIRWASPVLFFGRTATCDTQLGDFTIAEGDRVMLWYPSGNRDETVFSDPFRFDISRQPNPHVSFGGGGPHYCLGANLAKKEVQVMIGALVERFDQIDLAGPPVWMGSGPTSSVGVSLDQLPVRVSS